MEICPSSGEHAVPLAEVLDDQREYADCDECGLRVGLLRHRRAFMAYDIETTWTYEWHFDQRTQLRNST